jgi:hypothetical protein
MTSNSSLDQINDLLNRAEKKDENIRITRSIGTKLEFLDVFPENDHGQLNTSVFHKPAAEPYILPYASEHSSHMHCNTIKRALFRAVRLCSRVQNSDNERLHNELTLLLNGYPLNFVTYHFKCFSGQHDAMSVLQQVNDPIYQLVHKILLAQPSRRERQKNELISNYNDTSMEQQYKVKDCDQKKITVHFTFQSGPLLQFRHELRLLWEKYYIYRGSPMNSIHLQIETRSNKSLFQLFVKKKPPKNMLVNVQTGNTTTTTITNTIRQ